MAFTIGVDNTTSLGGYTETTASTHVLQNGIAGTNYLASSGDIVTAVGFWSEGSTNGTFEIGVYRTDTLALIGSAQVTASGAAARFTAAVNLALSAGVTYAIGWRCVSSCSTLKTFDNNFACITSAATGVSPLANPFVSSSTDAGRHPFFATGTSGAGTTFPPLPVFRIPHPTIGM